MLKNRVSAQFYKAYLAVASCVVVFLLIVGSIAAIREYRIATEQKVAAAPFRTDKVETGHPIYAYSVVPGGVWNIAAYNAALADPIVKAHYAGAGKPIALQSFDNDQYLYDSYRVGDAVYWTNYKVKIPAGEKMWVTENGSHIRLRCGNRLSFTPMKPVMAEIPVGDAFLVTAQPSADTLNEVLPSGSAHILPPSHDSNILPYEAGLLGKLLPSGKAPTREFYPSPSPFGVPNIVPTSFFRPITAIDDVGTPPPAAVVVASVPEPSYLPLIAVFLSLLLILTRAVSEK
jgi:hypothetical protein